MATNDVDVLVGNTQPQPIDDTLALSSLLRTSTSSAHHRAETSLGASWLTKGELDKQEYVKYIIMLWRVYDTLESSLSLHSFNPLLLPTHNPTLLARAHLLASDISTFLDTPIAALQSHPFVKRILDNPPEQLKTYTSRINLLSDSDNEAKVGLLLAHAYVRYLGDLSGGQVIKQRIAKAYSLTSDGESIRGVEFYDFTPFGRSSPPLAGEKANIGDMKRIKEWFRKGIDQGVQEFMSSNSVKSEEIVKQLKSSILEEANLAFELNEGLFSILNPPSLSSLSPSTTTTNPSNTHHRISKEPHSSQIVSSKYSSSNLIKSLPPHWSFASPSFLSSCLVVIFVAQYLYSLA